MLQRQRFWLLQTFLLTCRHTATMTKQTNKFDQTQAAHDTNKNDSYQDCRIWDRVERHRHALKRGRQPDHITATDQGIVSVTIQRRIRAAQHLCKAFYACRQMIGMHGTVIGCLVTAVPVCKLNTDLSTAHGCRRTLRLINSITGLLTPFRLQGPALILGHQVLAARLQEPAGQT